MNRTISLAAFINLFICFWVYLLHSQTIRSQKESMRARTRIKEIKKETEPTLVEPGVFSQGLLKVFLIGYSLSGFAALIYEIAWTRILVLMIGSSVYAFSLMLTAFIFGLALGSIVFSKFIDRRKDLILLLAIIEMIIGLSALAVVPLFGQLPLFMVKIILKFSQSFWLLQFVEFGLIFLLMLIPTTMMGAAFPLASRIYTRNVSQIGSSVGSVFSVNTLGSILGSFVGAFVLIPWLGIQKTILVAVLINNIIGCGFLFLSQTLNKYRKGIITAILISGIAFIVYVFPRWNVKLISSGAYVNAVELNQSVIKSSSTLEKVMKRPKILYHKEGVSTTVTVKEDAIGNRYLLVDGKCDASSLTDMPNQELLAHIPLLLHPNPRNVLVIGLASGVTLGSAGLHPVEHLDCVEISPAVKEASHYFDHINYNILADPRVELIIEDGRNHLTLTNRRYDVILSQPSNPWIAGISDLFTQEFFQLCKKRLNPQGITCVWFNAYHIWDEIFWSIIYTFHTVFPFFAIWESSMGTDYLLIGSEDIITLDYRSLINQFQDENIAADLRRINIKSANELLAHFVMDEKGVKEYLQGQTGIRLHTDDNAFVEFSAPQALYKLNIRIPIIEALNRFRNESLPFLIYSGRDKERLDEVNSQVGKLIKAKKHITMGNIYLSKGNENMAITEFEKAISLNPEQITTVKRYIEALAYLYEEKGQTDEAERLFKKVIALDPERGNVHYQMGLIHYQKKEWDQALKEFQLALQHLEYDEGYYNLSLVYHKKGDLKEAILAVKKALEFDPDYIKALNHLGNLYLANNNLNLAVVQFEKVLELDPEYVTAHINLGLINTRMDQMEQAIAHLQKALRLDPNNAEAHNNLGIVYLGQGRYDQAAVELKKALAIRSDYAKAMVNLGIVSVRLNDHQEAEEFFHQALALNSNYADAYIQLSYLYLHKREFPQALSTLKQLVRVQPENAQAYVYLGKTYQALDQTEAAIQAWQKAIALQPHLPSAHLDLGNVYFEKGDFQKAQKEWQQALSEKGIDIPTHLVNLGMFYFRLNQYNKAIKAWEKAVELNPDDPHLHYNIALYYFQKGQYEAATRALKESLRLKPDNQSAKSLLQRIKSIEEKTSLP